MPVPSWHKERDLELERRSKLNTLPNKEVVYDYAGRYPGLAELISMLERSDYGLPKVEHKLLPSAYDGAYDRSNHSIEMQLEPGRTRELDPVFAHEFTHSLHRSMQKDASIMKNSQSRSAQDARFVDTMDKLSGPRFPVKDPYRDTTIERTGFGMEKYLDPQQRNLPDKYKTNPHVDATSATDFYILMDAYNRSLKSRNR